MEDDPARLATSSTVRTFARADLPAVAATTRPDPTSAAEAASAGQVPALEQITTASRTSWTAQTCDIPAGEQWSPDSSSRGQCGTSALGVHEVPHRDSTRQGWHCSNQLLDGRAVDLTAQQLAPHEILQPPVAVERPPGPPRRCAEQRDLVSQRVLTYLGRHDEKLPGATSSGPSLSLSF